VVERTEPVFYVRLQPAGAARNVWHRLDLTGRVLSFDYQDDEKKADKLELTVDNFDLAHFDDPVWRTGGKLRISWGYPGLMSVPRTVIVRKVTGYQKLKIQADGLEVIAQREKHHRVWDNMKRSDTVRAIAKTLGYVSDEVLLIQDTEEVHEQIVQANLTDAEFIRRMAEIEDYLFYIDWEGFHFHPRDLRQQKVRELRYYNIEPNDPGEVISFETDADITAKPGRSKVSGRSPKTKKTLTREETADSYRHEVTATEQFIVDAAGNRQMVLGQSIHVPYATENYYPQNPDDPSNRSGAGGEGLDAGGTDPGLEPGQPMPFWPGEPGSPAELPTAAAPHPSLRTPELVGPLRGNEPDNDAASNGHGPTSAETEQDAKRDAKKRHRRVKQKAMKVTIKIVGDPTFVAKSMVTLVNVGKRMSQRYYVRMAQHTLNSGGFRCSLKATADGTGGSKTKSKVAPGFRSISVRAQKTRKPKPKEKEDVPVAPDGTTTEDPETGQRTVTWGRTEKSKVYVAVPGHSYTEPHGGQFQRADVTPFEHMPDAGAGGTGGGGPPPPNLPEEGTSSGGGVGGTGGGDSGDESQIGGGGAG